MDAQRRAFLADLEAELTTQEATRVPSAAPAVARQGGAGRRIRHLAATLLASASFFALSAGAASASTGSIGVADCMSPDFKNYDHTKRCGGLDIQRFTYRYTYSPNQVVVCHVFSHHSFTCNTWYYIGEKEACS